GVRGGGGGGREPRRSGGGVGRAAGGGGEGAVWHPRGWLWVWRVEPLLLETTTRVASSRSDSARRTACGSVVSSTVSGTFAVRLITSGASDEPPIPHSTTWSSPAPRAWPASSASGPSSARETRGASSQPSLIAASAAAAGPHRPAAWAARPAATPSAASLPAAGPAPPRTPALRQATDPPGPPAGGPCTSPGSVIAAPAPLESSPAVPAKTRRTSTRPPPRAP